MWKFYSNPQLLPPKDVPSAVLMAMRIMFQHRPATMPSARPGECTIDDVLALAQADSLKRAYAYHTLVTRDSAEVSALKAKYGVVPNDLLDPAKLNPEDARVFQQIMNETQPATREITLAQDVQNIRGWWSAAELIYATHKKDIANYGPVFEEFGKALQTRMAGLDERTRVMIGLWSKVNERLPSHEEQMMRVIANQSKKIEHQQ